MDELQIEKLRSSLISYQMNMGESGRALPWKSVLHKILMSPATAHCYPKDGSNPEFKEEALRRFAKNISLPSIDKLEDIKTYLIKVKFLSEAEFNARTHDLEEMKVVHSYLAKDDENSKMKLEYSQGTYVSERKGRAVLERSTLELKLDPSGSFLRATDEYEVVPLEGKEPSLDDGKPDIKQCKQNRVGYGFATTAENILYIMLRGENRDDTVIYMESKSLGRPSGVELELYRHGIIDVAQIEGLRPKDNPLYNIFHAIKDDVYKKKMEGQTHYGSVRPQLTSLETKELQNLAFLTAARRSNATKLQQLLQDGADINTQDDDGMTALHYVAAYGARPCLRVLLKDDRCDFLIKNNNGNYASDLAMLWAKDYAVCKLLNKKQALQALGAS